MAKGHALRVKDDSWNEIEKIAWKISAQEQRVIKPTDIGHAIIKKALSEIDLDEISKYLE